MRGFAAVFGRELFERRLLALVALCLGLAAVALPRLPGFRPGGVAVADVQGGMAFGFALLLTLLMALFLGGSIIASDLAERRLGFYFSRPLPGWAVWAGKMGAALVLMLGSGLLVLLPAVLMGGNLSLDGIWGVGSVLSVSGTWLLFTWGAGLLFLLFGAHAASIVLRSRSSWAVLDLVALGAVAGLFWTMVRRMALEGVLFRLSLARQEERLGIVAWMELGFFTAALLSLVAAGALQVTRGRTDLRRGHRVLSAGLWGMSGLATLIFVGAALWVLAAGPEDLRGVRRVSAAPAGSWIAFSGPAAGRPGYSPSFLYDVSSGRSVRARFGLIGYDLGESAVLFSADGRRAVWMEFDGTPFRPPVVIFRLDLDRPGARPVRTSISFPYPPSSLALSPDGRRLAAHERQARVTVNDVDSGRLLASVPYDSLRPWLAFVGADRLRIYDLPFYQWYGDAGVNYTSTRSRGIAELDLASPPPRLEPTGSIPGEKAISGWSLSPDSDRGILRTREALRLCDARTGEPLAELAGGNSHGAFLADGRIAVTQSQPAVELRIFSPDGHAVLRRLGFTGVRNLEVVDQPAPGLLRVAGLRSGTRRASWEVWLVDLETGGAKSQGTRRLAELKPPVIAGPRFSLEDKDGVIWYDPWSSRGRIVLKGS
ncbi:MAG: hypothetical protein ABIS20_22020 [Thermoanaerobaculia bacterium]